MSVAPHDAVSLVKQWVAVAEEDFRNGSVQLARKAREALRSFLLHEYLET